MRVINMLESPGGWSVDVIAAVSDAGPDPAKARWLLMQQHPQTISADCYGHQVWIYFR